MRVAINNAIGGFWPSVPALRRLDELGSTHLHREDERDYPEDLYPDEYRKDGKVVTYAGGKESRTCPILLKVIDELGDNAAAKKGSISVVEIPDDIEWVICDSESGEEWIAEKHRTWS